ncbi:two-component regulator propeller domain-containing protein [Flavobacterium sp. 102]|uniref:type IX secretion system anionic LPS delivery protein PorZ n=1 Tax=Flavobacterium sp. 102 TaxID=2135623 RepID=UPI000EB1E585|nr:two-component regulator propeller domain-containing protein [Flavobacterium sp. 102]RKS00904.1 two component regulator with propeller domain [Flavobacterium sp. 102]
MKNCFLWLLLFFFQMGLSQQNQNWKGYFSYNQIKDLSESTNKVYAAAENALFIKNNLSSDIQTINTIDGLSGQTISALYHSDTFNKTIVGYQNGLIIVINDADGSMLNVVDIINKNIPTNIKKVNHFMEHDGIVYVSCDFGIVQYKLATLEFGDTYFIGPNGLEIKVLQTTIYNSDIYAVTQDYGIRKAVITNPNLNDFAQWAVFDAGYWNGIANFNNQLIGLNTNNRVYKYNGFFFSEVGIIGQPGLDIRATSNYLIVTSANHVFIYNTTLGQIIHLQSSQITSASVTFTCATIINENIYIGTSENGVIASSISAPTNFEFIMPNGPIKNNMFAINSSSSNLWAVYGGYDISYNPYTYIGFDLTKFGISKYAATGWLNIPYSDVLEAKSLSKITVNPNDETQVYISSYHSGLLKLENDVPTTLLDHTNSGLESLGTGVNTSVRINGTAFDRQGNLWVTNSKIKNGLKVLRTTGQWQSYDMDGILDNFVANNLNKIVIDNSGTKWMATQLDGVIAFNENTNIFKKITDGVDLGNLPSRDVRAIAVDNRNQLWIGTNKGLRVLPSTSSYNGTDQMKANPIIILEEDLAQELLFEQFITDIAVNGSNQKWISTADSGVFLFSSNGQETIYHFTKDNSPLPSNVVNDVEINAETGEVFFATDKGLVSFQGTSTKPADSLQDVYVYPNPVRPEFVGTVKIAGLISKANIKITDIEGNLVYETTSEGGTVEWDTTAFGKYKVASGVYMIFIAAEDASETAVKKVMIIR